MRILDENGKELIESVELHETGRLARETIQTVFHEAVDAVEEVGHYETTAEYPNGGKEVQWVVDTPAVPAAEAYWETEDILRFVPFTDAEIVARRIAELTAQLRATDGEVLDALEGLLSCTTLEGFLSAMLAAAGSLKETLDARAALRAEILQKQGGMTDASD